MRKKEQLCVLGPLAGEYRLEYYAPYDTEKTGGISYSNDRMGTIIIIFFFYFGCVVLVFYSAHDLGRVYVHNVLKSLSSILIVFISLSSLS